MMINREMRIPAVQVEGLADQEIAAALAYELEPETGIPAAEAEVVWTSATGDDPAYRVFSVSEVRRKGERSTRGFSPRSLKAYFIFLVLIAVAVVCDGFFLYRRSSTLEREIRLREPLQNQLNGIEWRIRQAGDALQSEKAEREQAAAEAKTAAQLRKAYVELLKTVAEVFADRAVLTSLDSPKEYRVRLTGVSSDADTATAVQVELSRKLAEAGWSLTCEAIKEGAVGVSFVCEGGLTR